MTTTANASEDVLSFSVPHIHTSTLPEVSTKMHADAPTASVALKKEENGEVEVHPGGIGLQPQEVYDRQLQPWAAAIRRRLIRNLQWESEVLAAMQVSAGSSPSYARSRWLRGRCMLILLALRRTKSESPSWMLIS